MPLTIRDLIARKNGGPPITMLTAYDYPTAMALDECGIDALLVGDSVGTNVLGYENERLVTVDDMVHHTRAVRRGTRNAFVLVDFPYASYETPQQAVETALRLRDAGADGVKIEGRIPDIIPAIRNLAIPVCNHFGLMPQSQSAASVQGKTFSAARALFEQCLESEAAGAEMLLLEMIPRQLARIVTNRVAIPTIGIGAGPYTTGQVLVISDILGITTKAMRHSARYAEFGNDIRTAVAKYRDAVQRQTFPGPSNSTSMKSSELSLLKEWLAGA